MIKNRSMLEEFEKEYARKNKDTFLQRVKIFESLWQEARFLKTMSLKDPLENIEVCLRIAHVLNSHKSCRIKRS